MKKLFLLLAGGVSVIAANAQENQSVVLTHKNNIPGTLPFIKHAPMPKYAGSNQAAKTTGSQSAWFSFADAAASGSLSAGLYPIYNDSSLYVPYGNPTGFNWYIEGLGTSFDPTSARFTPNGFQNQSYTYPQPAFGLSNKNAYTVDSVTIVGYYNRQSYNNYVDTLNLYIAYTPSSGTALLQNKNVYFLDNLSIPDSTFHVADAKYDTGANAISSTVSGLIKITKILDTTAFADSVAQNTHIFTFPVSISVPAGGKIVSYQQFISGHKYRNDIDIDSANKWEVLTYERNGQASSPDQLKNDFNCGLIITNTGRYNIGDSTGFIFTSGGSNVQGLEPTYYYGAAAGFDDPFYAFHVNCTGCFNAGVANVSTIASSSAYPNPATSEVYIPFTLSHNANVNVIVTNTLGQVTNTQSFSNVTNGKAAFNTSSFAAGVYFYTVEANGERTTGRFVVAR